ncbi:CS1 type fimbrial major subunit [Vibrio sp. T20]|uniref:CS1 type fimbrial major subunit n=1 Tax=Vibrio sp. T20 TaxID=2588450 RepID=UPI0011B435C2|nr:CS1 type fimbrial major subunit [Vibrio sp. T20]
MFKNKIIVSLALAALTSSSSLYAAKGEQVVKTLSISATIPSSTFYVKPLLGSWPSSIQLEYNDETKSFTTYSLPLRAKSSEGYKAMINGVAEMTSVDGHTTIPLVVELGSNTLNSSTYTTIATNDLVDSSDSSSGRQEKIHEYDLKISAQSGASYEVVGVYSGTINLMFEDDF